MPQAIGWDRDFYVNDPSTVKKGLSVAETVEWLVSFKG